MLFSPLSVILILKAVNWAGRYDASILPRACLTVKDALPLTKEGKVKRGKRTAIAHCDRSHSGEDDVSVSRKTKMTRTMSIMVIGNSRQPTPG